MMYYSLVCPVCRTNLEVEEIPDTCAACKVYIKDRFPPGTQDPVRIEPVRSGGMSTAKTKAVGLVPLDNLIQTVY